MKTAQTYSSLMSSPPFLPALGSSIALQENRTRMKSTAFIQIMINALLYEDGRLDFHYLDQNISGESARGGPLLSGNGERGRCYCPVTARCGGRSTLHQHTGIHYIQYFSFFTVFSFYNN